MLIILFGLAGSGKNFVGEIFQSEFGFDWLDGDDYLTADMQLAIEQQQSFTQNMRDEFTQELIKKITEKKINSENLVVTQALYKEKNREQIISAFPEAKLIQVVAEDEQMQSRIQDRNNNISFFYAEKIKHNFEVPRSITKKIKNNFDRNMIVDQIEQLFFFEKKKMVI